MGGAVKPLVSVIIPARNAGPWIHDCIASVVAQDYKNWEVIVVENGSTDNTKNKVKEFSDERIKAESIESVGVSRARNHGFAQSTGEVILFLDADDMLHATALSRLCNELEQNPKAVGVIGSCLGMSENGISLANHPVQRCPAPPGQLLTLITNNYINNGGQLAVRRSAIRGKPFNEEISAGEDCLFWAQMLASGHFAFLDPSTEVLFFRQCQNSAFRKSSLDPKYYLNTIAAVFSDPSVTSKMPAEILPSLKREMEASSIWVSGRENYKNGNYGKAIFYMMKSILKKPDFHRMQILILTIILRGQVYRLVKQLTPYNFNN